MKTKSFYLVAAASLLGWSIGNASVTSVTDAGWTGGIYCYSPMTFTNGDVSLGATETGDGKAWATINTTGPLDPTLTIDNAVDNDTAFVWTEYIVDVSLNADFTIQSAAVTAPASDWVANITQPGAPVAGIYTGVIDYVSGTPVQIAPGPNSEFDFNYQIMFSGLSSYSLSETVTPVPEPATLSLLLVGGLLLGGRAMPKRR